MKKIRMMLPLLSAGVFLLSGVSAQAAKETKAYTTGTKTASIEIQKSKLQSFDGTLSVTSKTDGKKITVKSASVKTGHTGNTEVCSYENGKIFMVTDGTVTTLKVTVNLEFSGDGVYEVKLSGYGTNEDGDYSRKKKNVSETVNVTVGAEVLPEEETEEETKPETEDTEEAEGTEKTEEKDKEIKKKTEDESETTVRKKETSKEKEEQEIAAERLVEEILAAEAIKEEAAEEEAKPVSEKKGGISILPILLGVIGVLGAGSGILFWKLKKGKAPDYDGAPTIDYDIAEDDVNREEEW